MPLSLRLYIIVQVSFRHMNGFMDWMDYLPTIDNLLTDRQTDRVVKERQSQLVWWTNTGFAQRNGQSDISRRMSKNKLTKILIERHSGNDKKQRIGRKIKSIERNDKGEMNEWTAKKANKLVCTSIDFYLLVVSLNQGCPTCGPPGSEIRSYSAK